MKMLVGSVFILLVILLTTIIFISYIEISSDKLVSQIIEIESLIEFNQWSKAINNFNKFEEEWEKAHSIWKIALNHQELDKIEKSLASSKQYILNKNIDHSFAELATLKFFLKHVYQREKLNLQNIM